MGQAHPLHAPSARLTTETGDRIERIEHLLDAILLALAVAAAESDQPEISPDWGRVLELSAHHSDTPNGELALRRALLRARTGGFHEP